MITTVEKNIVLMRVAKLAVARHVAERSYTQAQRDASGDGVKAAQAKMAAARKALRDAIEDLPEGMFRRLTKNGN